MARAWGGRSVLWVAVLAAALAAAMAGGLAAEQHLRQAALTDAFARLRLFHQLRQGALEDYLSSIRADVIAASDNPRVVEAMENLTFAFSTLDTEARKTLQYLYVESNPFPAGEREKLETAEDRSYYGGYHQALHRWARRFRAHFAYYDVFLISTGGDIVYSVKKEIDFATNLKTGPYRRSPLAEAFRRAVAEPDAAAISDFAKYPPSADKPAAFAARAIKKEGQVIGVFAVQIPAEPLNDLLYFTAGMGASGETYLVGPDGLMRSQSRFSEKPTNLEVTVASASVGEGQSGKSGAKIVKDYRGIPVLSVFAPVDFGGHAFVLLAEIDEAEVLSAARPELVFGAAALSALVAALLVLLAWALTSRRRGDLAPAETLKVDPKG
jgi:methyl-accepting chemotaxis protein